MRLPADPAKRAALLAVGGLVVGLGVVWVLFGRGDSGGRGIGMARVLEEERKWRKVLWVEGLHINERELWEIQETLAVRAGISTAGLKGLVRRAANAKDAGYRAEGHLLAGNVAVAAVLAGQVADWQGRQGRQGERARWLRRRADALWRGQLEDAGVVLREALGVLGERESGLRGELLEDLAGWHWERVLFRPEDPVGEMERGVEAVGELLAMKVGRTADEVGAAWRLRGRFLLRRACVAEVRDGAALEGAVAAFEEALRGMSEGERWAAVQHELGVSLLEKGDWAGAVERLGLALKVRDGKVGAGGRVDVRVIERRLTERLQTLACLALAEAKGGMLEAARGHAEAVHGMTLPEDGGLPWIMAQAALVEVAKGRGEGERVEVLCREAVRNYPVELVGEPGVPLRGFFEDRG
jgi:hypothetical protein